MSATYNQRDRFQVSASKYKAIENHNQDTEMNNAHCKRDRRFENFIDMILHELTPLLTH